MRLKRLHHVLRIDTILFQESSIKTSFPFILRWLITYVKHWSKPQTLAQHENTRCWWPLSHHRCSWFIKPCPIIRGTIELSPTSNRRKRLGSDRKHVVLNRNRRTTHRHNSHVDNYRRNLYVHKIYEYNPFHSFVVNIYENIDDA